MGASSSGFNPNVSSVVYSVAVQADGKILLGGGFSSIGGTARNRVARLNSDGSLDSGFNPDADNAVFSVAVQADGKILLGGLFTSVGGTARNLMARLNNDNAPQSLGAPDPGKVQWLRGGAAPEVEQVTFELSTNSGASWTPLGSGARIAGGWERSGLSLPASGSLRARGRTTNGYFNGGSGLIQQLDDFGPAGSVGAIYNPNLTGIIVYTTAVQPDGKTIIGGDFTSVGGTARNRMARLNSDGSLDSGFNPNANNAVYSVAVQADGKILLGGDFTTVGGTTRNRVARLNSDGSLDPGFNPNASNTVFSVAVQADGKILLGGDFTTVGGTARNRVARLNSDGSLDSGFNPNADNTVRSVAVQADGKILLGGDFTSRRRHGAQPGGAAQQRWEPRQRV